MVEPVYVLFSNPPGPGVLPLVNEAIVSTSEDGKNDMVEAVRRAADKGCEFVEVETAGGRGVGVGSLTMRGYWAVGPLVPLAALAELLTPFAEMADWCDEMRHEDGSTCGHRIEAKLLREVRALVRLKPVDGYDAEVRATASAARAGFRSSLEPHEEAAARGYATDMAESAEELREIANLPPISAAEAAKVLWPPVEADTRWARAGLKQVWVVEEADDKMARLVREGAPVGYISVPVPSLRHGDNGWRAAGTVENPVAWSA